MKMQYPSGGDARQVTTYLRRRLVLLVLRREDT